MELAVTYKAKYYKKYGLKKSRSTWNIFLTFNLIGLGLFQNVVSRGSDCLLVVRGLQVQQVLLEVLQPNSLGHRVARPHLFREGLQQLVQDLLTLAARGREVLVFLLLEVGLAFGRKFVQVHAELFSLAPTLEVKVVAGFLQRYFEGEAQTGFFN